MLNTFYFKTTSSSKLRLGKKESIIFIPSLRYLCNETYISIAKHLSGFKKIYLNIEVDFDYEKPVSEKEKTNLLKIFDNYEEIEIGINPTKNLSLIDELLFYKKWIKKFKSTIEKYKPLAIVFPSDNMFALRVCRIYFFDIKRIVVQPCQRKYVHKKYSFYRKIKYILYYYLLKIPMYSRVRTIGMQYPETYFLFWSKKWLGIPSLKNNPRVIITGAANYDKYFNTLKSNNVCEEFKNVLSIPPKVFVITIALSKTISLGKENYEEFLSIYRSVAAEIQEVTFIFKVHPLEDESYSTRMFSKNTSSNTRVTKTEPMKNLLAISDCLITQWSSAINEALVQKIPVLLLNPNKKYNMEKRFLAGFLYIAQCKKELIEMIRWVLSESGRQQYESFRLNYLQEMLYKLDGKSGQRAAKAINEIIEN